jgi:hypothetical protein
VSRNRWAASARRTAAAARRGTIARAIAVVALVVAAVGGCKPPDEIAAPEVRLRHLHVRQYSGGVAEIEADLSIKNPNSFDVSLVAAELDLSVRDALLGRLVWTGQAPLTRNIASPAMIPAEFEVGDHDDVFAALFDGERLPYAMTGTITVARGVISLDFPVDAAGVLNDRP